MHELSQGGMGGFAVHPNTPYAHVGEQQGPQSGTTLLVQPLEVCNTNSETQDTRYQPIVFRSSNLFYIKIVRFRIWVPYQNFIY